MLKISAIKLNRLRNEMHYQFCTDFKNLVIKFNPMLLRLEQPFNLFQMFYEQEGQCLKLIMQNPAIERLNNADLRREVAFSGLFDAIAPAKEHFKPQIVEAANKLTQLMKWYTALPRKTFDEETMAIENLTNELRGKFVVEVELIGIFPWIDELESRNKKFIQIMAASIAENNGLAGPRIKNTRAEMDKLYQTMAERINALMLVENNAFFEQFICDLNNHIDRYEERLVFSS